MAALEISNEFPLPEMKAASFGCLQKKKKWNSVELPYFGIQI